MKNIYLFLSISVFAFISLSFVKNNQNKKIEIRYQDFYAMYNPGTDCISFDYWADDCDTLIIEDAETIYYFISKLQSGIKDTIEGYSGFDVRAKIIVYNELNNNDTICVSRFNDYSINNIFIQDSIFVNYIKELLNQIDYWELDIQRMEMENLLPNKHEN